MDLTQEPTSLATGKVLRERLKGERPGGLIDAAIDSEYFLADRILHNHVTIKPALAAGRNVVSDRYDLGTLAYQSTQGLPIEYLLEKRKWMLQLGLVEKPAVHILVDAEPESAMRRLRRTGKALEKFEHIEFLAALRRTYLELPGRLDDRIAVVDAEQGPDEVLGEAKEIVRPFLPLDRRAKN